MSAALLALLAPAGAAPVAWIFGAGEWEQLSGPGLAADLDGDGSLEIALGSPLGGSLEANAGAVYLLEAEDLDGELRPTPWVEGATEHDRLGVALATLGAGDGRAALAIGLDHSGLDEGSPGEVAIFFAPRAGGARRSDEAELVLGGGGAADRMGAALAAADLDGDGIEDLAIAAPTLDNDGGQAGRIWLVHGPLADLSGALDIDAAATGSLTGAPRTWLGMSLVAAGDLDGDGVEDLAAGSLGGGAGAFSGAVHVFTGLAPGTARTDEDDGRWTAGRSDALAGTVLASDRGGTLYAAAPTWDNGGGRIWRLDGRPDGVESLDGAATAIADGAVDGAELGAALAWGAPGLLAGAPGQGTVWLLDPGLQAAGAASGQSALGGGVGWIPDLDGDGAPEALLGDPEGGSEGQGFVAIVSELTGPLDPRQDSDGDGAADAEDCDPADPRRAPTFGERCRSGLDEDCDGAVDEAVCERGCASAGASDARGLLALGAMALLRRRRRGPRRALAPLALAAPLAGCAPELALEIPPQPLEGEIAFVARGEVDQLVLLLDGAPIGGGPGPEVEISWQSWTAAPGDHWLRLQGYRGDRAPLEAIWGVEVGPPSGDPPTIHFVEPSDGALFEEDEVWIQLEIEAALPAASVWVEADGERLAELPPEGPWVMSWEEVGVGWRALTATAEDIAGQSTSTSVEIYMAVDHDAE